MLRAIAAALLRHTSLHSPRFYADLKLLKVKAISLSFSSQRPRGTLTVLNLTTRRYRYHPSNHICVSSLVFPCPLCRDVSRMNAEELFHISLRRCEESGDRQRQEAHFVQTEVCRPPSTNRNSALCAVLGHDWQKGSRGSFILIASTDRLMHVRHLPFWDKLRSGKPPYHPDQRTP